MKEHFPCKVLLLDGRVVAVEKVQYEAGPRGVYRIVFRVSDEDRQKGCLASVEGDRMVEITREDSIAIARERVRLGEERMKL